MRLSSSLIWQLGSNSFHMRLKGAVADGSIMPGSDPYSHMAEPASQANCLCALLIAA